MARASRLPAPLLHVVASGFEPELALAVISTLDPGERRQVLIELVSRAIERWQPFEDLCGDVETAAAAGDRLPEVLDRFPDAGPWAVDEVRELLGPMAWAHYPSDERMAVWRRVVSVLHELDADAITELETEIETCVGAAERSGRYLRDQPTPSVLFTGLLAEPRAVDAVLTAISRQDPFGAAVRVALRHSGMEPSTIETLVRLCHRAGRDRSRDRWRDEVAALVGRPAPRRDVEQFVDLVAMLVSRHHAREGYLPFDGDNELLAAGTCSILGVAAAAGGAGSRRAAVIDRLRSLVLWGGRWVGNRPTSNPVARGAIAGLVAIGDDRAIAALREAQERVGQRAGLAKPLAAAIDGLLQRSGKTLVEIVAGAGPTFELDPSGRRSWMTSAGPVELVVEGGSVTVTSPCDPVAAAVAEVVAEARSVAAAIEREIRRLNDRTDGYLRDRATFTPSELTAFTGGGPLQAAAARGLVWEVRIAARWRSAWRDGDRWVDVRGRRVSGDWDMARLWHPVDASSDEVAAWRTWAIAASLRQPVRQVFREVYEELADLPLDGPLRMRKAEALLRSRGWRMTGLGGWDGGQSATATRSDPATGHRVELVVDGGHAALPDRTGAWCVIDPASVMLPAPAPDTRVFRSEVLRDLDLVVTSAGMTARDVSRSDAAYHGMLATFANQPLRGAGLVRRDLVRRLLAAELLPDTIGLDGAFLVATHADATLRIHLGTAVVVDSAGAVSPLGGKPSGSGVPWLPVDDPVLTKMLSAALRPSARRRRPAG